jgi:hypothetical protein
MGQQASIPISSKGDQIEALARRIHAIEMAKHVKLGRPYNGDSHCDALTLEEIQQYGCIARALISRHGFDIWPLV